MILIQALLAPILLVLGAMAIAASVWGMRSKMHGVEGLMLVVSGALVIVSAVRAFASIYFAAGLMTLVVVLRLVRRGSSNGEAQ